MIGSITTIGRCLWLSYILQPVCKRSIGRICGAEIEDERWDNMFGIPQTVLF